jgi:hypothetical protein
MSLAIPNLVALNLINIDRVALLMELGSRDVNFDFVTPPVGLDSILIRIILATGAGDQE